MIYARLKNGQHFIVMEPGNIERLKRGRVMKTPDNEVLFAFAPDMEWTMEQFNAMMTAGEIDIEVVEQILKRGLIRPEVLR